MNPDDIAAVGLSDGARVTVRSEVGSLANIRVAAYDIARGSAAMYYPEANVLVHTRVDPKSGTPAYKNVRVRVVADGPTLSSIQGLQALPVESTR
jgi:anaerobic selenocysteine-containing dehydrogenase